MVSRSDLTQDEYDWLLRLQRRQTAFLTTSMANRLTELGLAKPALGGTVISDAGKRLLISGKTIR